MIVLPDKLISMSINKETPLTVQEIDILFHAMIGTGIGKAAEKNIIYSSIPVSPEEKQRAIKYKVNEAAGQIAEIFAFVRAKNSLPIEEIERDIIPVINEAVEIPHVYYLFQELYEKDEYTYRHTICVAVIAGLLGKWLGFGQAELRELELAGILHDIGKTMVPEYILRKPGKLTQKEFEEIKKHTIHGYRLIRHTSLPDSISLSALQHHEREDGTGYPFRLKGSQIHPVAKIIAVADVFHAMSSDRVYRNAEPFYKVIAKMNEDVYGRFDPAILLVFIRRLMETLIGKRVRLSDGTEGVILLNHPYNPLRSTIMADNQEIIDLSKYRHLNIDKVLE